MLTYLGLSGLGGLSIKLFLVALEMGITGKFFKKDEGSDVIRQIKMIALWFFNRHNVILHDPYLINLCMIQRKNITILSYCCFATNRDTSMTIATLNLIEMTLHFRLASPSSIVYNDLCLLELCMLE